MEDQRIIWMKERTYAALSLQGGKLFEDLLQRDSCWAGKELQAYLDRPAAQYSAAVLFYPLEREVEEETEVVEGKFLCVSTAEVFFRFVFFSTPLINRGNN